MSDESVWRPRVLLGELEPMVLVGMTRVLVDGGALVLPLTARDGGLVDRAVSEHADVVVLAEDDTALSDRVRAAAPAAKIILWPSDETEMTVYDPGSATPRRVRTAAPEALVDELGTNASAREKE